MADQKAILVAVVPKFGAALSLMGSSCIIAEVAAERRRTKIKSLSRILFSMSFSDLFFSTGWFLSSWPSPKYTAEWNWQPVGNTQTCSFQAFIIQVGWVATPIFNLMLTLFYMLMIRYNYTETQLTRIEPWIYAFTWSFAVGSATLGVALKLFNSFSTGYYCWFDSLPQGCSTDPNVECIRGQNSPNWAMFFQSIPLWPCIIFSAIFMGMIYRAVKQMEQRNAAYAGNSTTPRSAQSRRSKAVARQAWWYIGAFLVTFLPDQISTMLYLLGDGNVIVDIVAVAFLPAQGFFNFLVFLRSHEKLNTKAARFLRSMFFCKCCGESKMRTTASMKASGRMASVMSRFSRRSGLSSRVSSKLMFSRDETRHTVSVANVEGTSSTDPANGEQTATGDNEERDKRNSNNTTLDVMESLPKETCQALSAVEEGLSSEKESRNSEEVTSYQVSLEEAEMGSTKSSKDGAAETAATGSKNPLTTSAGEQPQAENPLVENTPPECNVASPRHTETGPDVLQRPCREEGQLTELPSYSEADNSIQLKV